MKKGLFITFEGIEGSGKSTHCALAADYLRRKGKKVLLVREPGGTAISEKIRNIILDKTHKEMAVECEVLLYNAARVQLVTQVILPAIKKGMMVLCDRFTDSTIAYQCFGGKLPKDTVRAINAYASCGLVPRMTFLLDSAVERGLARAGKRGSHDRMELKALGFHKRVRAGFLWLAEQEPQRICLIPEMPIADGHDLIRRKLDVCIR